MKINVDFFKFEYISKLIIFVSFIIILFYRTQTGFVIYYDGDSFGYLRPAVNLAEYFKLDHLYARPVLYSWILGFFLLFVKKIAFLGLVQHILGAISFVTYGLGIYKLANIIEKKWLKIVFCVTAFSFSFFIFMSPIIILNENLIRPEGIINFFNSIIFYNIICIAVSKSARWWNVLFLVMMSIIIYLLKPHLAIQALLGIMLALTLSPTKKNVLVVIFSTAIVCVLLLLPEQTLARRLDPMASVFLPKCLVMFNAGAIKEIIEDDVTQNKPVSELTMKLLKGINFELHEVESVGPVWWFMPDPEPYLPMSKITTQYIGDRLFYVNKSIADIDASFPTSADQAHFYRELFFKALVNKPSYFYEKIIRNISNVYSLSEGDSIKWMHQFYQKKYLVGSITAFEQDFTANDNSRSKLLQEYKNDLAVEVDLVQPTKLYYSKLTPIVTVIWLHGLFIVANILMLFLTLHFFIYRKLYSDLGRKLMFFNMYIFLSILMTHITAATILSLDVHRYIQLTQFWTLSFILITYSSTVRLGAMILTNKNLSWKQMRNG